MNYNQLLLSPCRLVPELSICKICKRTGSLWPLFSRMSDACMTSIKIVQFSRLPTACPSTSKFFSPTWLWTSSFEQTPPSYHPLPSIPSPHTPSPTTYGTTIALTVHVNNRNQNKNKSKSHHIQVDLDHAFFCSI